MKIKLARRNALIILILLIGAILMLYFWKAFNDKIIILRVQNMENLVKIERYFETDTLEYFTFLKQVVASESTVTDRFGNILKIHEIVNDDVLIVRFSEDDCSTCLKDELGFLFEELSEITYPIILLGTVEFNPTIKAIVENQFENSNIYYINQKYYNLRKADTHNRPYYILCDKNLVVMSTFFPLEDFPEKRANFYKFLKKD